MADRGKGKRGGLDNQALKEFRSKVAKLKRKGIVSKRVDARKQSATKYMRAKVRKFEDVLSGQAIAVKAKKNVREKYVDSGIFQERGSFLIVPKEHERSRARIKKGRDLIEIVTPLKWGEEREVVLPFKATNMLELANKIISNPAVDDLKKGDEQFAFRLFEHNSRKAFVNREEFGDYVLRNYQHLFSNSKGLPAIRHLSVIRFRGYVDQVPESPNEGIYDKPRKMDAKGRNSGRLGTYERQRNQVRAAKKKKLRDNETAEQRKTRLEKQKTYQRQYDAKRRAEREAKKKGQ